jgi:hypothetical protein
MLTETEAKTKWCPLVRAGREAGCNRSDVDFGASAYCIGNACMAWRVAAPLVRRHAQALIHGIDLKLVHVASTKDALAGGRRSAIDHDKDLDLVLTGLREALARSGAV